MSDMYVADSNEIGDGERKLVRVAGMDVAILNFEGELIAFENRCRHQGGPVGEGMLINKVVADIDEGGRFLGERFDEDEVHIVCPWHGWEYVLPTGECAAAPGLGLKRIPVTIDDGRIYLAIPSES